MVLPHPFSTPLGGLERTLTPSCHQAIRCISLSTACSTMLIHRWLEMTYNFISMRGIADISRFGVGSRRAVGYPNQQET
jgi:hypothetical protein